MEELLLYINTLKKIIDKHYEKEVIFYEEGKWWSREHSKYISPKEVTEWALELINPDSLIYTIEESIKTYKEQNPMTIETSARIEELEWVLEIIS